MVIKPLVGTGDCNNTILCINCVFWETVSICAAVHVCNWNSHTILNYITPSTDRVCFIPRVALIVTPYRFVTYVLHMQLCHHSKKS